MDKKKFITDSLVESSEVKINIQHECMQSILDAVEMISRAYRNGHKVLLCGNGGSAADCQHIATELMVRLNRNIERPPLPAVALTTDTSNLTASGNDIGFKDVFSRSILGLGNPGDILIAISTSGSSPNIVRAAETAKEKSMRVIGFLGGNGGNLKSLADISIIVPSANVQRIQEGHITIAHIICELVETELHAKG